MFHRQRQGNGRQDRCRGNALLELALVAPFLILMFLGTADFSRVFRDAGTVTAASESAAFWGAMNLTHSGQHSQMETVASSNASELPGFSSTADHYCDCPDNPATGPSDSNAVSCATGTCPGYGFPRSYVRVRGRSDFDSLVNYPGLPGDFTLGDLVYMRVQ